MCDVFFVTPLFPQDNVKNGNSIKNPVSHQEKMIEHALRYFLIILVSRHILFCKL